MNRILIIEDNNDVLVLITEVLINAGYEVSTGKDVTAFYEIEKNLPDLILLNHWLKGKTGHEICLQLKGAQKTKNIPVVLISSTPNLSQTAQSCGADAYLSKPFEINELLSLAAKFCRV